MVFGSAAIAFTVALVIWLCTGLAAGGLSEASLLTGSTSASGPALAVCRFRIVLEFLEPFSKSLHRLLQSILLHHVDHPSISNVTCQS